MAQLYLTESPWRMLRRALKHEKGPNGRKTFTFDDARNQTRHDARHLDQLVNMGMVKFVSPPGTSRDAASFALTPAGRAAADLGAYEWNPTPKPQEV